MKPVVEMLEQAREFFNMPQFVKDSMCPYQPTMEIGYSHVQKQAKEFFAVPPSSWICFSAFPARNSFSVQVRLKPDGESMETNGAELISDEYQCKRVLRCLVVKMFIALICTCSFGRRQLSILGENRQGLSHVHSPGKCIDLNKSP